MIKKIVIFILILFCGINISVASSDIPSDESFINLHQHYKHNAIWIDVRSQISRGKSHLGLPGEIWINPNSLSSLNKFINENNKESFYTIFCSCPADQYSIAAWQLLHEARFNHIFILHGGWSQITKDKMIFYRLK